MNIYGWQLKATMERCDRSKGWKKKVIFGEQQYCTLAYMFIMCIAVSDTKDILIGASLSEPHKDRLAKI